MTRKRQRLQSFQSTLPSQGATFFVLSDTNIYQISIHAPLTGSDVIFNQKCSDFSISIHAPLTGSDSSSALIATSHDYFNPRSPHRERHNPLAVINPLSAISIHAPLTGSDDVCYSIIYRATFISIHAPLTGSDSTRASLRTPHHIFQSTLPSQGATANIHIKFLCDLLFSTLSSKNSFTLSRFPQTIT